MSKKFNFDFMGEGANGHTGTPFHLYENFGVVNDKSYGLRGHTETNEVSALFYSEANVFSLKNDIESLAKRLISDSGTHAYVHCSEMYLLQNMRTIYMESRLYDPNNSEKILIELNRRVKQKCVPEIITNTKLYAGYLEDIQQDVRIMEPPKNVGVKGYHQLETELERYNVYENCTNDDFENT